MTETSPPTVAPAVRAFRIVAVLEAISWLALIVATIVKYTADNALGVHIMGPVHGALFLAYVALVVFEVRSKLGWSGRTTLIVLADSIIPGGGFLAARRADLR